MPSLAAGDLNVMIDITCQAKRITKITSSRLSKPQPSLKFSCLPHLGAAAPTRNEQVTVPDHAASRHIGSSLGRVVS